MKKKETKNPCPSRPSDLEILEYIKNTLGEKKTKEVEIWIAQDRRNNMDYVRGLESIMDKDCGGDIAKTLKWIKENIEHNRD